MAENRPGSPEQGTTPAKKAAKKAPAKKSAKQVAARKAADPAARKRADPAPEPPAKAARARAEAPAAKAAEAPAGEPTAKAAKPPAKKGARQPAKKAVKKAVEQPALVPLPEPRSTADPAPPGPPSTAKPSTAGPTSPVPATREPAPAVPAPALPAPAVPASRSATGTQPAAPGVWAAAAWEAVRRPELPPWQLAELAVAELGPRAAAWVDWLRRIYPRASADGIARLATHRAGRLGRATAGLGLGGPVAALVSVPAAGWVRASVVLRVAAAYGHDPTDPRRASDLLELLGLAPDGNLPDPPADPGSAGARAGALLKRLDLLQATIVPLGLGRFGPLLPLRAVLRTGEAGERVDRLAHRAIRRYRPGSQSSTEASARSSSSE